jgi:hypothetical protein
MAKKKRSSKKKTTRKKGTRKKGARKKATRRKAGARRRKRTTVRGSKRRRKVGGARLHAISTAVLQAELARRDSEVDKLQRERDSAASRLAEIDSRLALLGGSAGPIRRARRVSGRRRPRNDMNLADSLASVLKGRKLSVTELTQEVQRAGYRTSSPNFRTIVNQTLIKDPKRFKKVSRGVYTV